MDVHVGADLQRDLAEFERHVRGAVAQRGGAWRPLDSGYFAAAQRCTISS
jgi:hypothetical protein